MKPAKTLFALICVLGVGCGGGDGGGDGDDATAPDASTAAAVTEVDCASATIAELIVTDGAAYSPNAVTISAGEVVRFQPAATHDVASNDGLFSVGFGGDGCFRFDEAGSYTFHCTPHGFSGTVTVQ